MTSALRHTVHQTAHCISRQINRHCASHYTLSDSTRNTFTANTCTTTISLISFQNFISKIHRGIIFWKFALLWLPRWPSCCNNFRTKRRRRPRRVLLLVCRQTMPIRVCYNYCGAKLISPNKKSQHWHIGQFWYQSLSYWCVPERLKW